MPARAGTRQLIKNGDFETGNFNGWQIATVSEPDDPGSRNFYISTPGADTPTDNGNVAFPTAGNPLGGNFYAVSNADFAGESVLYQQFTVAPGTTNLNYSFQLFVNDQSGFGGVVDPSGLDYTTGGKFDANQFATVDILKAGSNPFSTQVSDVVATLYGAGVDSAVPADFTTYTGDLTDVLTPGDSYILRFGEVDNLSALNLGVDNVSLKASGTFAAPESSPLLLVAAGLPLLAGPIIFRHRFQKI